MKKLTLIIFMLFLIFFSHSQQPWAASSSTNTTSILKNLSKSAVTPMETCQTLVDFYKSQTELHVSTGVKVDFSNNLHKPCGVNIKGKKLPLEPHPFDVLYGLGFKQGGTAADGPGGSLLGFVKDNYECDVMDFTAGIDCHDCPEGESPPPIEVKILCGSYIVDNNEWVDPGTK